MSGGSILLDKAAYELLTRTLDKELFVFQWLSSLEKQIPLVPRAEFKPLQNPLTQELQQLMKAEHGPPVRKLLGNAFVAVYTAGDPYSMYDTVSVCLDVLKTKPAQDGDTIRLGCIEILGQLYEKQGRNAGGVFPDALAALIKSAKSSDSTIRRACITSMEQMITGLQTSASYGYKDMSKCFRSAMSDKVLGVRCAAVQALLSLAPLHTPCYTAELESNLSLSLRALEGANYETRIATAALMGTLLALAYQYKSPEGSKVKSHNTDEILSLISASFLHGSLSLLKTSGVDLGKSATPRDVRVGVTEAYTFFFKEMGSAWVVGNLSHIVAHLLELLANGKATPTHVEAVYSRKCVAFIMDSLVNGLLGEASQQELARILITAVHRQMEAVTKADGGLAEAQSSQHIITTALYQLSAVLLRLGTSSMSLITDHIPLGAGKTIMFTETLFTVLVHPSPAARLTAAWCLRCTAIAVPAQLTVLVDICTGELIIN